MKYLITAGPTHEHLDPVRFIGNNSSGKQGILLSIMAGIHSPSNEVILVLGPTQVTPKDYGSESLSNLKLIRVTSADEMYQVVSDNYEWCDVAIFAAAVADYKSKTFSDKKIKRDGSDMTIELTPNKDIAMEMGKRKSENQVNIGFALETNDGLENALKKIQKKNLDFIVLNETSKDNPAFGTDDNQVTIMYNDGSKQFIEKTSKLTIAKTIVEILEK